MRRKIVAAGGLVENGKGELLIIFRRGKWDLPKGKLDNNESIEECALREVEEETGLKNLRLENLIGTTYHEYFDKYSNEDVLKETYWFFMRTKGKTKLIPQTDEDITEIIWADEKKIKECLQNTYPNIIEIVQKFTQNNRRD